MKSALGKLCGNPVKQVAPDPSPVPPAGKEEEQFFDASSDPFPVPPGCLPPNWADDEDLSWVGMVKEASNLRPPPASGFECESPANPETHGRNGEHAALASLPKECKRWVKRNGDLPAGKLGQHPSTGPARWGFHRRKEAGWGVDVHAYLAGMGPLAFLDAPYIGPSSGFSQSTPPPLDLLADARLAMLPGGAAVCEHDGRLYAWQAGAAGSREGGWRPLAVPDDAARQPWRMLGLQGSGRAYAWNGEHLLELNGQRMRAVPFSPANADTSLLRVAPDGQVFTMNSRRSLCAHGRLGEAADGRLVFEAVPNACVADIDLPDGARPADFLPLKKSMLVLDERGQAYVVDRPVGKAGSLVVRAQLDPGELARKDAEAIALGWGSADWAKPLEGGGDVVPQVLLAEPSGRRASARVAQRPQGGGLRICAPEWTDPLAMVSRKGLPPPAIEQEFAYDGTYTLGVTGEGSGRRLYFKDTQNQWHAVCGQDGRPLEGVYDIKLGGGAPEDPAVYARMKWGGGSRIVELILDGRNHLLPAGHLPQPAALAPQRLHVTQLKPLELKGVGTQLHDFTPVIDRSPCVLLKDGRVGTVVDGHLEPMPLPDGCRGLAIAAGCRSDDPVFALVESVKGGRRMLMRWSDSGGTWFDCALDWREGRPVGLRSNRLGTPEVVLEHARGVRSAWALNSPLANDGYSLSPSGEDRAKALRERGAFRASQSKVLGGILRRLRIPEPTVTTTAGASATSANPLHGIRRLPKLIKSVLATPKDLLDYQKVLKYGRADMKHYYAAAWAAQRDLKIICQSSPPELKGGGDPRTAVENDLSDLRRQALGRMKDHVAKIVAGAGLPASAGANLISTGQSPHYHSSGRDLLPTVVDWWGRLDRQQGAKADGALGKGAARDIHEIHRLLGILHQHGIKMPDLGRNSHGRDDGDPFSVLWGALGRDMSTFAEASTLLNDRQVPATRARADDLKQRVESDPLLRLRRFGMSSWKSAEAFCEVVDSVRGQLLGRMGMLHDLAHDSLGAHGRRGAKQTADEVVTKAAEAIRGLSLYSTLFFIDGQSWGPALSTSLGLADLSPVDVFGGAGLSRNRGHMLGVESIPSLSDKEQDGSFVAFIVRSRETAASFFAGGGVGFKPLKWFTRRAQAVLSYGMSKAVGDGVAVLLTKKDAEPFLRKCLDLKPGDDRFAALDFGLNGHAIGLRFNEDTDFTGLTAGFVGGRTNRDVPLQMFGQPWSLGTGERGMASVGVRRAKTRFALNLDNGDRGKGEGGGLGLETHEARGVTTTLSLQAYMQQGAFVTPLIEDAVGLAVRAFGVNPAGVSVEFSNNEVDKWTLDAKPAARVAPQEWLDLADKVGQSIAGWPPQAQTQQGWAPGSDPLKLKAVLTGLREREHPPGLSPKQEQAYAALLTEIDRLAIREELAKRGLSELQPGGKWEVNVRDVGAMTGGIKKSKVGGEIGGEMARVAELIDQVPGLTPLLKGLKDNSRGLNELRFRFERHPDFVNWLNRAQYEPLPGHDRCLSPQEWIAIAKMAGVHRLAEVSGKTVNNNASAFSIVPLLFSVGRSASVASDVHDQFRMAFVYDAAGRLRGGELKGEGAASAVEQLQRGIGRAAEKGQFPAPRRSSNPFSTLPPRW